MEISHSTFIPGWRVVIVSEADAMTEQAANAFLKTLEEWMGTKTDWKENVKHYVYSWFKGRDVLYICGSDEHGVPITITAEKEGITPQE